MGRIVIGGLITTIARSLGVEPNPEDRVQGLSNLIKLLLNKRNSTRLRLGACVGLTVGTGFCRFPMLRGLPYFTELTFNGYLVILILSSLHHLSPLSTYYSGPSSSFQPTSHDHKEVQATLRSIQQNKPPNGPMLKLNMLFFMTLLKSFLMGSLGC